ncbi:MAG TPA: DUF4229 domain-containing protein [Spirillospora sp.]
MRSVIVYTVARVAIFAATAGVLALLGARGFLLVMLAVLISGVVSYVVLAAQRDRMSAAVVSGMKAQRERFHRAVTKEDA